MTITHPPHVASRRGLASRPQRMRARQESELEQLWDRHSASVYTLALVLVCDETAAAEAVRRAWADLSVSTARPRCVDAHRTWARCVYLRSQEVGDLTPSGGWPSEGTEALRDLPPTERACVALCLFGGHTYREVAHLLGVPPMVVAELLTTSLRTAGRPAGDVSAASA